MVDERSEKHASDLDKLRERVKGMEPEELVGEFEARMGTFFLVKDSELALRIIAMIHVYKSEIISRLVTAKEQTNP